MNELESIILGIVQGLTEFLPVSSSGHLELVKALFGDESIPEEGLLFSVVVHAATALSTIVVFRKDIGSLLYGLFQFQWNESTQYVAKICLSMIPVGVIGIAFEDQIEQMFSGNVLLVGMMLMITALLLLFTHYTRKTDQPVTTFKAFIIGIAQSIAIFPGISRSGATISTALLLRVDKAKAARFSFLMVLAPILGASALKLKDYFEAPAGTHQMAGSILLLGFISAFISGLFACTWMLKLVKRGKLIYFALYCFIVGTIAIAYSLNVFNSF